MKRVWLKAGLAVVLAAGAVASAAAADLPTKKEPAAPAVYAPLYSWTGFYVGANVGGIWGTGNITANAVSPAGSLSAYFPTSLGSGPSGWLGGGQAGYNFQDGSFVFGAETDIDWTSLNRSSSYTSGQVLGTTLTTSGSARMEWLGTLRLRAGVAASADNRLLIYGTGGLAYGGGTASAGVVANGTNMAWYGSNNPTKTGWTIGGGAEYAITNNITLRAEYLYYDLGSQTETAVPNTAASNTLPGVYLTTKTQFDGSIFRIGANYKF